MLDFKIAKRFFTISEHDYILSCKNPEYAFCEIWTKKEAYLKCIGTGLSTPLNSFNVLDNQIGFFKHTFEMGKYTISTCCRELIDAEPTIVTISKSEMQTLFKKIR